MSDKKYFWLKLDRNFFKRHDIRIIEEQENGKDYILFYLKLLVESIDHEGCLRFSESIPYDEKMLAIVTNTNVDIVRQAIKIFSELKMMQVLDDKTIYLCEVQKMIGSRTAAADRVRAHRERQQGIENKQNDVTCNKMKQKCNIELEKDIDKEQELNNNICAFEKFYSEYPRKKSKDRAESTFTKIIQKQKIKTQEQLDKFTNELISAINLQKTEYRLKTEAGQKMPDWRYPSTWLNDGGWKDEVDLSIANKPAKKQSDNAGQRMKNYARMLKDKHTEEYVKPIGEIEHE
jgi:predicted phage replisome organizer